MLCRSHPYLTTDALGILMFGSVSGSAAFYQFAGENGFLRHFAAVQSVDERFYQLLAETFQTVIYRSQLRFAAYGKQ